tara:strand:- start:1035 stop:1256 length:222 start_codon:yes stop_codon:yes gene_type:complete
MPQLIQIEKSVYQVKNTRLGTFNQEIAIYSYLVGPTDPAVVVLVQSSTVAAFVSITDTGAIRHDLPADAIKNL